MSTVLNIPMPDQLKSKVAFIAGPTASGKSAAALSLAQTIDGEIVNADAMQVYRDLRIVTARPSIEDEKASPHHLYGTLDGAEHCSAGRWARIAADAIADINSRGKTAIITGGTGLYFKALEEGLSPIPEIPDAAREAARARFEEIGAQTFRNEVLKRDPAIARLPASDTQRLLRAWEVFEATGKPLSHYQNLPRAPLIQKVSAKAILWLPRETLYRRCEERAERMVQEGAIEEVKKLFARNLSPDLPLMKALGVPELTALLMGECSREEALADLQQNTRRFAKRQMTWFRRQAADWPKYENAEDAVAALESAVS